MYSAHYYPPLQWIIRTDILPTSLSFTRAQKPPIEWLDRLTSSLQAVTLIKPAVTSLDSLKVMKETIIFVGELMHPVLSNLDADKFSAVKTLFDGIERRAFG